MNSIILFEAELPILNNVMILDKKKKQMDNLENEVPCLKNGGYMLTNDQRSITL